MSVLSKSDILAADDRPLVSVSVPEWGGEVLVRAMSVGDLLNLQGVEDGQAAMSRTLALSLVGEDGQPLFSEDEVEALKAKAHKPMMALWSEVQRINGLGAAAEKN